jgi:hypothetical protein
VQAVEHYPKRAMGIVKPPDPDFTDTKGKSVTLPTGWYERVDAVAKSSGSNRYGTFIQLMRWSLDQAEQAPTPPAAEVRGDKETASVSLSLSRWEQLAQESEDRGLSLNKVFQSHLFRALVAEEKAISQERKARR